MSEGKVIYWGGGAVVFAIKSRRNKLSGQTARLRELRNAYEILAGKPLQKRQVRKHMCNYKDNIKIDITRSGCVTCGLTEDRVHCKHCIELFCVHNVIQYGH